MPRKNRVPIPAAVAAEVLFHSDRICCVCRSRGKPVQIHHIDDDPSNNDPVNLSVLCFDCHRETQISGGFDRKLDAGQVTLYRDDWHRIVADARATSGAVAEADSEVGARLVLATTLAEIYREREDWFELALHYRNFGNEELRDKYVEKAIESGVDPWEEVFLRSRVQHRPELLPPGLADQVLAETEDWTSRARMNAALERHRDAVTEYCEGIIKSIAEDNTFTAAFYLKEITSSGLWEELFKLALHEAIAKGELWWQIRALDELGWDEEKRSLVLSRADDIRASGSPHMLRELALAEEDEDAYIRLRKEDAERDLRAELAAVEQEDAEVAAMAGEEEDAETTEGPGRP